MTATTNVMKLQNFSVITDITRITEINIIIDSTEITILAFTLITCPINRISSDCKCK